jgi:hypothetical protein
LPGDNLNITVSESNNSGLIQKVSFSIQLFKEALPMNFTKEYDAASLIKTDS